jgi:hypothetical protein
MKKIALMIILFGIVSPAYSEDKCEPLLGTTWLMMPSDYPHNYPPCTFIFESSAQDNTVKAKVINSSGMERYRGGIAYCSNPDFTAVSVFGGINNQTLREEFVFTITREYNGYGTLYLYDADYDVLLDTYELDCRKVGTIATTTTTIAGQSTTTTNFQTTTTTINTTPFECEVTPVSSLEGTLWKQVNRETYIGFYRGYLYQYFGETSPEDGFIKYGRFTEFGNNLFFSRWGLIVALQTNTFGKWECNNSNCLMNTIESMRPLFIPWLNIASYDLVCSDWSL